MALLAGNESLLPLKHAIGPFPSVPQPQVAAMPSSCLGHHRLCFVLAQMVGCRVGVNREFGHYNVTMCSPSLHGTQPADNSSQHLGTFLDHHSWSRPVARHTSSNPICQYSWCLKLRRTTQCAFVCSCVFLIVFVISANFTQVRGLQGMILLNSCSLFKGTFFATLLP